jgi:hypothetical protein
MFSSNPLSLDRRKRRRRERSQMSQYQSTARPY